jgi:uncharacterized membrane protein
MPQTSRRFAWSHIVFGGLALVGLVDAMILTIEHYTRKGLPCTFTGGCERVLTSRFSEIAGQPIALLGVVFYGVVLYLVVHSIANREMLPKKMLLGWSFIGFLSSLGLTFIQAFIIKAWCQYCLLSALTSTLIFVSAIIYWRKNNLNKDKDNDEA